MFCACGSLAVVAKGMCAPCLARQQRDRECFDGKREQVLERDLWTCQGCGYRPLDELRDYLVVHHRVPGVSKLHLMISLCPACHAIVHRLKALRTWLPPRLVTLWHEQHPSAPYQLQLDVPIPAFNPSLFEIDLSEVDVA
jgi:hypothetical protein